MVDKPSANIYFVNDRARDLTSVPLMVEVGAYDYPVLQDNAVGVPSLVMQARAAMAIATAVPTPQRPETEFRNARVAIDTMEELFKRASAPDVVAAAAHGGERCDIGGRAGLDGRNGSDSSAMGSIGFTTSADCASTCDT